MDERRLTLSHTPQEVRLTLVEISDELATLDSMAFADKHRLNLEADQLRNKLSSLIGDEMREANRGWADRAGRKGDAGVDPQEATDAAMVSAQVYSDGGGSG